jgi:hypothetical protein
MNRSTLSVRKMRGVALAILLSLLIVLPASARFSSYLQEIPTPTVRPTATPAPYLELSPTQGIAGEATPVIATGGLWAAGRTMRLYWDDTGRQVGEAQILGNGTFQINFTTPTDQPYASVGTHQVLAICDDGTQAQASFELIVPTPTQTPTNAPPPTNTSVPPTKTPKPPTNTPSPSPSPSPSATLRPITPMVTITPIPETRQPTKAPTKAPVVVATRTPTRPAGTPTSTFTPSPTFTSSPTPGPGTPSVTPQPTATFTPTPAQEISDTGGGWGTLFLWGFVLAGLLIAFRLLRVRGMREQR